MKPVGEKMGKTDMCGVSRPTRLDIFYTASVVKEVLGEQFDGVVVSDFYAAYNAHLGLHQRCWVHLLRDIHELKEKHKEDRRLKQWVEAVKAIYEGAKQYKGPSARLGPVEQKAERVKRQ